VFVSCSAKVQPHGALEDGLSPFKTFRVNGFCNNKFWVFLIDCRLSPELGSYLKKRSSHFTRGPFEVGSTVQPSLLILIRHWVFGDRPPSGVRWSALIRCSVIGPHLVFGDRPPSSVWWSAPIWCSVMGVHQEFRDHLSGIWLSPPWVFRYHPF